MLASGTLSVGMFDHRSLGKLAGLLVSVYVSYAVVSDSFNPLDFSPLGSSVHGVLQAKLLEWVALSSSRGSS